ncbi:hypothetical protein CONCODRAFT_85752 [Conidiobolus coronatus NRRL 28638]|uniref:SNARE-complex protein Syntaxin-18 N-terminal domain-containing protein n=1 Tax=Conidiobolus coronatus (strain ATCC 28846 / CBS 209.66 / NRRL 28638) TaxID=796925 RepID=A0A137P454_CONC2|nr:hypothetical protein CONCODRAFT_85752 [Conidiobolus coronatus NRRL 28638]|eukprot:KXN69701.1 hypothetical protein CONCODRAFT_85752 [Conidiobolus coronatus NRRL 28638]
MIDLTQEFLSLIPENERKKHPSNKEYILNKEEFSKPPIKDLFLIEAYRIAEHINNLENHLIVARRGYLDVSRSKNNNRENFMSDEDRDEFEKTTKIIIQNCLDWIQKLEESEAIRQKEIVSKIGWSSFFNKEQDNTNEEIITTHHSAITWLLNKLLVDVSQKQKRLQEQRLKRELDRQEIFNWQTKAPLPPIHDNPSLYKALSSTVRKLDISSKIRFIPMVSSTSPILEPVNVERSSPQSPAINLEPEQQQMLELENKELVSQFESSMNQIKQIERSLVDISQMQSTLSTHLAIQSKETEKLYSDAVNSTDSMSAANQYLRE